MAKWSLFFNQRNIAQEKYVRISDPNLIIFFKSNSLKKPL